MYKVLFEPTYDEPTFLGQVASVEEAMELIYLYCSSHHCAPNITHWHKIDMPSREIVDVETGYDYFSITNESGGRVNIKEED